MEEALAEVEDALGRGYYEHGAAAGAGYRNGYRTGRLKTAEGPIAYAAPQVASRQAPFRSALREGLQGRTETLEDLAVELFARGLSTRDIADVFAARDGRPLLSRAAVSQLSELCGPNTRPSPAGISPSTRSSTCSSTALPSGCGPASRASRCSPPGASPATAARCSCT